MRLLLDQNVPRQLAPFLTGHEVSRAAQMGWSEISNGELLAAAEAAGFEVLVTADQNIRYQQNMTTRVIALVVLSTNNLTVLQEHIWLVTDALDQAGQGDQAVGSMIHLAIGGLHLDWGAGRGYIDHSSMFQPKDIGKVPYYYANCYTEYRDGLCKPLYQVIERLRLEGTTLDTAEYEYEVAAADFGFETDLFPFDELKAAIIALDVAGIADDGKRGKDFADHFRSCLPSLIEGRQSPAGVAYTAADAGEAIDCVTPYSILTILSLNPAASDLPVRWGFADLEDSGWGRREDFAREIHPLGRIMIVTEGSSDAAILKHGFAR